MGRRTGLTKSQRKRERKKKSIQRAAKRTAARKTAQIKRKLRMKSLDEFRSLIDKQFPSIYDQRNSNELAEDIQKRYIRKKFCISDETDLDLWSYTELVSLESKLEEDPLRGVKPIIAKRAGEYSLRLIDDLTDEHVQIYKINSESGLTSLIETNKMRPMKLNSNCTDALIDFIRENSEFYNGYDFIRSDGIPIDSDSETHEICKEIFENINLGIEIFPYNKGVTGDDVRRGYSVKSARKQRDPIYRTEGQKYLESMNPDKIIEGVLLGNGDISMAFVFGDNVIIEAKDLGKATYVTTNEAFDTIRYLPRWNAMKLTNEDGLMDRIFHKDVAGENFNFEKWKEKIVHYISEH